MLRFDSLLYAYRRFTHLFLFDLRCGTCEQQAAKLELEKTQLQHQLKEKVLETLVQLESNLLDKYCYLSFAKVFKGNRIRALKVSAAYVRTYGICNAVALHIVSE